MSGLKIKNIVPLTELQRSPSRAVKMAIGTKDPVVITQHGKPAVVIVDCETYEKLEESAINPDGLNIGISDRERMLRDELQRILLQIVTKYDPERVILFGSLASGTVKESSDIDLVIIKETKMRYWDRMRELSKAVRPRLACDLFVYTPEEWKSSLTKGCAFATDEIKKNGKILYERAA